MLMSNFGEVPEGRVLVANGANPMIGPLTPTPKPPQEEELLSQWFNQSQLPNEAAIKSQTLFLRSPPLHHTHNTGSVEFPSR